MIIEFDNIMREKDGTLSLYVKIDSGQSICVQGKDMKELKDKLSPRLQSAKTVADQTETLKGQAIQAIEELKTELGLVEKQEPLNGTNLDG
jgi:hypothetical protein